MAEDVKEEPTANRTRWPVPLTSAAGLSAIAGAILLLVGGFTWAVVDKGGSKPGRAVAAQDDIPVPMPVAGKATVVQASDYSVVSVFEGEAFLATANDLVRVVVGVQRSGLGTITSVTSLDDGGGLIVGTEASLRTQ